MDRLHNLAYLLDRQAIHDVLQLYCRGVDRGDAALVASAFHDDGVMEAGVWAGPGDAFAAWIVEWLRDIAQCQHRIGNCLIDLDGDVADVETYCCSITDSGTECRTLYVRYLDRFEKRGGEWRIARRRVVYDIGHSQPNGARFEDADPPLVWGRRDASDPSYPCRGETIL